MLYGNHSRCAFDDAGAFAAYEYPSCKYGTFRRVYDSEFMYRPYYAPCGHVHVYRMRYQRMYHRRVYEETVALSRRAAYRAFDHGIL